VIIMLLHDAAVVSCLLWLCICTWIFWWCIQTVVFCFRNTFSKILVRSVRLHFLVRRCRASL